MAFNIDLAVSQLLDVYRKAYIDLLNIIATKEARGNSTAFEHALLADVNRIITRLDKTSEQWAGQVIPKAYSKATEDAMKILAKAGLKPTLKAGFAKVHQSAVAVLVDNFYGNMYDANHYVARRIQDNWRKAQLQTILQKETTGRTMREAQKSFVTLVGEQGLGAFKDAKGRTWRLDAYADMAVRSVTAECQNMGLMNQMQGMGYDLVQMSNHSTSCEICAPYEGRVYSISGKTPGYPKLEIAYREGYALIHPRCRHRITSYVPELDPHAKATKEFSNRSFDTDPRAKVERERYEREQEKNRQRRETRKQWEKYKAVLPDDTPGLAQFTRMKNAKSEKYQELQEAYKEAKAQI